MLEAELRPAVHAWLVNQGLTVIYEFQMGGYCDMVGVKFARRAGRGVPPATDAVAVELKLSDVAGVIVQAKGNRHSVRASCAAMPWSRVAKMRGKTREQFREAGIGLLAVTENPAGVIEYIKPGPPLPDMSLGNFSRRWWNRIVRDERLGRKNAPGERRA